MLVSRVDASEAALAVAARYAALGMQAYGFQGEHTLSATVLLSYTTRGDAEADLHPSKWVPHGFVYWVLRKGTPFAYVTVTETEFGPQPSCMEFLPGKLGFTESIAAADRIADEPGEREMRLVDIPNFNALLIWVTGDRPRFIDRVRSTVYTEEEITIELIRRRHVALGTDPEPGDEPGFRF